MPGWSATLLEASVLDAPVMLRPMRPADERACVASRRANDAWLRPWEPAPSAVEPPAPGPAGRLLALARRTSIESYATALYRRSCAFLGLVACWGIWYDGQFAGQLTVFRIAGEPLRSAEVGYWVDQRLAGRGIAPTALALATDHCFGAMRLHRLEAGIQPENLASRRTVEKLGFRAEGVRERQVRIDGAWRDHICYAITAEEVPSGLLERWRKTVAERPAATGPVTTAAG